MQLQGRHPGEKFVERQENEWPIARTQWTKFYFHPEDKSLTTSAPKAATTLTYDAMGDGRRSRGDLRSQGDCDDRVGAQP